MNAPPRAAAPARRAATPPAAVWVAAAIVALVGLQLVTVAVREGWPYVGSAGDFGRGSLERGFVLLAIGIAGCGVGLVVIAYRLLRGDRVARAALVLAAAAVALAGVGGADGTFGLVPDDARVRRALVGGSVLVAVLAGALPASRRFFRGPDGARPAPLVAAQLLLALTGLSVLLTAAVALLFGVVHAGFYLAALLLAALAGGDAVAYRRLARGQPDGIRSTTIATVAVIVAQTALLGRPSYLLAVGSQVAVIVLVRRRSVREFLSAGGQPAARDG